MPRQPPLGEVTVRWRWVITAARTGARTVDDGEDLEDGGDAVPRLTPRHFQSAGNRTRDREPPLHRKTDSACLEREAADKARVGAAVAAADEAGRCKVYPGNPLQEAAAAVGSKPLRGAALDLAITRGCKLPSDLIIPDSEEDEPDAAEVSSRPAGNVASAEGTEGYESDAESFASAMESGYDALSDIDHDAWRNGSNEEEARRAAVITDEGPLYDEDGEEDEDESADTAGALGPAGLAASQTSPGDDTCGACLQSCSPDAWTWTCQGCFQVFHERCWAVVTELMECGEYCSPSCMPAGAPRTEVGNEELEAEAAHNMEAAGNMEAEDDPALAHNMQAAGNMEAEDDPALAHNMEAADNMEADDDPALAHNMQAAGNMEAEDDPALAHNMQAAGNMEAEDDPALAHNMEAADSMEAEDDPALAHKPTSEPKKTVARKPTATCRLPA
ncbi:hypothetical protein WJX72_002620 [[Myrmecia] bisecta]|uniref:Zinc finger PHD-type domain-containing protein n=1 Tax=[Myrmecia] bisecta TaxID=41462 RepID=A0AAW1QPK0_9CHLO